MRSTLALLASLKLNILLNSLRKLLRRSKFEFATLIFFLIAAEAGLFFFFHYSFRFFRGQEPFGPLLIDEAFYLFNFSLFIMFVISAGVSAYSSLFRSREILFLLARPIHWQDIYILKLAEALWQSTGAFLLAVVPFMAAFGINKNTDLALFPALCFFFYLPFLFLSAMLGTLAATLVTWALPNGRSRKFMFGLVLALIAFSFMRMGPETIKEQGSIAGVMTGYLPHVAFAKNEFLPSSWLTRGILGLSELQKTGDWGFHEGCFYFLLILSNALFFMIPSLSAAQRLYPQTFLKAQDFGEAGTKKYRISRGLFEKLLDSLPWPSPAALAFMEKDWKTFMRDASEWSQLIIFFGLLLLYFANLRNLGFHVLEDIWKDLVFALNTVGTFIVLSSFNMRFVFPMLSLEGQRAWIVGTAPMRFSSLLLVKFMTGFLVSLALTLPLVFISGWMLEIPAARIDFALGAGFFVCVALTGLSVGMGARFPNFKSNNPSEIISGFGGSLLLMMHLFYLAGMGIFLVLSRQPHHWIFLTMATVSLLSGMIPMQVGVKSLQKMEF